MKKPLVILTGPTAVGKTEQQGIPHYLIDALEPWEEFHVVKFQEMAQNAMKEIYGQGRIPIITGGTGFYIQALLYDIDFTENEQEPSYRKFLEELAQKEGAIFLHNMLKEVDDAAAREIHANNIKRVIRALEFYHFTGKKISEHNETERQKESPYRFCYFVLNDQREKLYDRINSRVDKMLKDGLLEEVSRLKEMGCNRNMVSMQGLGYKEIFDFLEGKISLEDAIYFIKRDTRHFAKRQLTWFRREQDVIWLNKDEFQYDDSKILDYMKQKMIEAGIDIRK